MAKNETDYLYVLNSIMAANLKSTRELLGLTQDALADQLGLSKRSLQRYELGHREIPQSVRFQVMLQFGRDIGPSAELLEQAELLKVEGGMSGSWLDRIGGPRWKRFRAEVRVHRLLNFSPWAQNLMIGRDYALLFSVAYLLGDLVGRQHVSDANELLLISWIKLSLFFFLVPVMFASLIPELPLAKATARILKRKNPNM